MNDDPQALRCFQLYQLFNHDQLDYGADAVWLAQEYGKSRRGERDRRFTPGRLP